MTLNILAIIFVLGLGALFVIFIAAVLFAIRKRNMQYWIGSYILNSRQKKRIFGRRKTTELFEEPIDVYIALCDHFEPEGGKSFSQEAVDRVERWCREYPERFSQFHDSSGRVPQHTFFYPEDEYSPIYLDKLAKLCSDGFGDVDIHLHHDNDTPEGFQETMENFRDTLFNQHGLLRKHPQTGKVVYGFIHGNWSLCNSRPDGRYCGVDHEIPILIDTGCYADFTMPSAPSDTQTEIINSLYYAQDIPGERKSHNTGIPCRVFQPSPQNSLLMVQGPLLPDWSNRKLGIIPRIENSDIHGGRPANWQRFQRWIKAGIHVEGCPERIFIKLHTHGAKPSNIDTLLGEEMASFHAQLETEAKLNSNFRYHYVTAWEMAQKIHETEQATHQSATPSVKKKQIIL